VTKSSIALAMGSGTDALRYDWGTLPAECRVIANLPYNISSQILMAIVEHHQLVQSFSVMLE
ncbi:rRNA adenine N-6-methyltransferase family protein, partial [Providencia stuartii]|uniref:rRNA adenine N-6-methyltransferase family protein n=1 Tax=Providencia stuartii TaxID=588 RepID=UPI0023B8292E